MQDAVFLNKIATLLNEASDETVCLSTAQLQQLHRLAKEPVPEHSGLDHKISRAHTKDLLHIALFYLRQLTLPGILCQTSEPGGAVVNPPPER